MSELPSGFTARIGSDVWRHDGGRILVGGAPTRVVRLSASAAAMVKDNAIVVADHASEALAMRLLDAGIAHPLTDELPPVGLDELTVIIPSLGRSEKVRRLLRSLPGVRVVVVDDGTPEPDAEALAAIAEEAGVRLVRLPENRGSSAARNAGLAVARTPFVAFIDSDVVVPEGALDMLLRHFVDPGLALIGPRVKGLPAARANAISRYENARSSLDLWQHPALVRPRSSVAWMSSTCLIARTVAIPEGFDESLRVGEDVDLIWRLARTPWRVRYAPEIEVLHEHRTTLVSWMKRKSFYGTGGAPLADRHPRSIPPAILRPWSAVMLIGVAIARPWSLILALGAIAYALCNIHSRLSPTTRSWSLALRLTGSGVLSALAQGSALLLRHWWPLTGLIVACSRRARRLAAFAGIADAAVEYIRLRPRMNPVSFLIARRLDDLAYGWGVWAGALRRRSARVLHVELFPDDDAQINGRRLLEIQKNQARATSSRRSEIIERRTTDL